MTREVDAAFLAFLAEHDARAEHRDRIRRLERQGAPDAVVDAEVLTGGMFPGFAASRAAAE